MTGILISSNTAENRAIHMIKTAVPNQDQYVLVLRPVAIVPTLPVETVKAIARDLVEAFIEESHKEGNESLDCASININNFPMYFEHGWSIAQVVRMFYAMTVRY